MQLAIAPVAIVFACANVNLTAMMMKMPDYLLLSAGCCMYLDAAEIEL